MPIPRGEINPQFHPTNSGSFSQISHYISAPIPPRSGFDRVIGVIRGPQAESVVVLCGQDDSGETGLPRHGDPLSRAELGGVEHGRVRVPRPPLRVRESVGAEMQEEGHLRELP